MRKDTTTVEHLGLGAISGSLVILEGVQGAGFDEVVKTTVNGTEKKLGHAVEVYEDKVIIRVFEGAGGMALRNTHTRLTGHPVELAVSESMLGHASNGIGVLVDGLGDIRSNVKLDINGKPLNPATREYPHSYIHTDTSVIDGLTTLIHGQKLSTLPDSDLPHDSLTAQTVQQVSLGEDSDEEFTITFAVMGVKYNMTNFFRRTFEESGVSSYVAIFISLTNDPVVECLITPRVAPTLAEHLAFEKGIHILVTLADMAPLTEVMHGVSSSKDEIPSRRSSPDYLYNELVTIYKRAGTVANKSDPVTQMPILTTPSDNITHPILDLARYVTEGQIILGRDLHEQSIYLPVNVLPPLFRLTEDSIGRGFAKANYQDATNQLFPCYAKVGDARALASVIGGNELSPLDKRYLELDEEFERHFVSQSPAENCIIIDILTIGWGLLGLLPREEPDRIGTKILDVYYKPTEGTIEDQRVGGVS